MLSRLRFAVMGRSLLSLGRGVCSGPGQWIRLLGVYFMLVVDALLARPRRRPVRLRLRLGGEDRDWWVADAMEVGALWEVFVAGEYGDWLPEDARLVVDAGANVGTATAWFRQRYPHARVIAVEPNPFAVERLRLNVGDDPNVEIVHAALADSDGTMRFSSGSFTVLGQLVDDQRPDAIAVEALTLETLRARFAPDTAIDVLKIDTEGAEWHILSGSLSGVGTVALEVHEPLPDGRDPDEVLREVAAREGFELRAGRSRTMAGRGLEWLLRPGRPGRLEARPAG